MLAEWHVTPDYIVANWTEELLNLMVEKLVLRKEKESEMYSQLSRSTIVDSYKDNIVSDSVLFAQLGDSLKVVKKNGD